MRSCSATERRRSATMNWLRWCLAAVFVARARSRSPTCCCDRTAGYTDWPARAAPNSRRTPASDRPRPRRCLAALELGRRTLTHAPGDRVRLRSPKDAAEYLLPTFGSRAVEQFGIVLLDSRHRVLKTTVVASGSQNATIVQPRDVFREAILGAAAAVVAFHNHPSGDPSPSPDDLDLTRRLAAAGRLMGIDLVDHVVLGDARYCSFKELGQL